MCSSEMKRGLRSRQPDEALKLRGNGKQRIHDAAVAPALQFQCDDEAAIENEGKGMGGIDGDGGDDGKNMFEKAVVEPLVLIAASDAPHLQW